MKSFDWQTLLKEWNHVLFNSKLSRNIPAQSRQTGWVGRTPATEGDLVAFEQKIRRPLPPSYRQFLGVTNGWALLSIEIGEVWSLPNVAWFAERYPDTIEALEDLGLDEELGEDISMMRSGLAVSDFDNGEGIVLNPTVVGDDGEWQAVRFHDTDPPDLYENFWELMQAELRDLEQAMAFARGMFGRTDTIPAHKANQKKVSVAVGYLEDRIRIMERGAADRKTPPDERLEYQQMAQQLKEMLARVLELKAYDSDPAALIERKAALVEAFQQPDFIQANYDLRYVIGYCVGMLES